MDTKSSNIKSNLFLKIFTVILSIVLCCIFTANALTVAKAFYTFGDEALNKNVTVYDTAEFKSELIEDTDYLISSAVTNMAKEDYTKYKKQFTEKGIKLFLAAQNYFYENKEAFDSYIGDYEYEEYISLEDYIDTLPSNMYFDEGKQEFYFSETLPARLPLDHYASEDISFIIPMTKTEKDARKILQDKFDDQMDSTEIYGLIHSDYDGKLDIKSLRYYLKAEDGTVVTNVKDFAVLKKEAASGNSVSIIDGVFSDSKIASASTLGGAENYSEYIKEGYIVIDIKPENQDVYSDILENYNKNVQLARNGIEKKIAICLVCLALLFILLIISAIFAGHTKNGTKTFFIDKIPNDLHLVINGAIISGISLWLLWILDEYLYSTRSNASDSFITNPIESSMFMPALMCAVSVIWLLAVELITSYARQIKTKSKFLKNTVIYFVLHILYKAAYWIGKNIIIKPFKFIKNTLSYKPEAFKKQFILYVVLYALINLILLFSEILWSAADAILMTAVTGIFWAILNAASAAFVAWYMIQLDKIISSIKNNTTANVNYNKLPNSLKILYDSQQSTQNLLDKAVDDAVKNERMRIELITNVSHDLKTPLTSIINYVDLLKHCDIEDETAKEYIGVLDDKGAKLKRLIEDLIEASKVTSGVITLNPVELDLSELATQAVVEHQQEFTENGLELIFKGTKQSHMAYADGQKTFRVIENLLSNAKKYSAKGSRVYADVYEQNGISVFEIKNISQEPLDISPDELKKRFVRGDKSRNKEGNGLGLSIADNLCSAMHGRMEISIDGDLFKVKVFLPKNK